MQALEMDPQDASVWLRKGLALSKLERHQEALEAIEKTLQIDPQNASAWSNRGLLLAKLGRHEEAAESFKKLTEVSSKTSDVDREKGWLGWLLLAGRKKTARNVQKMLPVLIDMFTSVFNLFSYAPGREPFKTQSDSNATSEPKCEYEYWATGTKCARPLLKGYDKCFWHVTDIEKYDSKIIEQYFGSAISLKEALEAEVRAGNSLEGAYLRKARVGGDWIRQGPMLAGAILRRADLSEAYLSCGSLNGADLAVANMEEAYLSDVDFRNAKFWYTKLYRAKFRNNDFTGAKGLSKDNFRGWKYRIFPSYRILETFPDQCEWIYRGLAKHFIESGLFDAASWAAYRERLMHHKLLLSGLSLYRLAAVLMFENDLKPLPPIKALIIPYARWVHNFIKLLISYLSRFAWGYGERPLRVGLTSALVIIGYAALFTQHGALWEGTSLCVNISETLPLC